MELSVRHLIERGDIFEHSPALRELTGHPDFSKLSRDRLAHDSEDSASCSLYDLQQRAFDDWCLQRMDGLVANLDGFGFAEGKRKQVVRLLDRAEKELVDLVSKARQRYRLEGSLYSRTDLLLPENLTHAADLAEAATAPDAAYALSATFQEAEITDAEALAAVPYLRKLAKASRSQLLGANIKAKKKVPRRWSTLWSHPTGQGLDPIAKAQVSSYHALAPVLLPDKHFRGRDDEDWWLDLIDQVHRDGITQPVERNAEAVHRRRRSVDPATLPVNETVTRHVAEILNNFFANLRLSLTANGVKKNILNWQARPAQ